jgi:hypothetical protein
MGWDGVGAKSYDRKKVFSSITHSILSRYKVTKGYVPFIQWNSTPAADVKKYAAAQLNSSSY